MAVRDGVGINEVQNFGKYRVTGPNARAWLDRIMAGLIPKPGRLSPDADAGRIAARSSAISPCPACRETEFQLTASYGAQGWHGRWFEQTCRGRRAGREHLATRAPASRSRGRRRASFWRGSRGPMCRREAFKFMDVQAHDRGHGQLHRAARQLYRRSGL